MQVFRDAETFRTFRESWGLEAAEARPSLGFVPTMGALHRGHEVLIGESLRENAGTVVSIFVNPLQFGPKEDLSRYPRPFERDLEICRNLGVTAVFAPREGAFYAPGHASFVTVEGLDRHLCGAARPGHFRGVCTVVLKFLNLVGPTRAYFGQKDIQQALILMRMVRDLSVPVEMRLVPTVREESGLALSSRNLYLSESEREGAAALYRGLRQAEAAYRGGERRAESLKRLMRETIEASAPTRIDYAEAVSRESLAPVETLDGPSVLAVAVFYGTTRLIDNILIG